MNFFKKLIITLAVVVCIVSLMTTGVYSAVTSTLGISNTVTYIYEGQKYTIKYYKVDVDTEPTIDEKKLLETKDCYSNKIDNILERESTTNIQFIGWYTYNSITKRYGNVEYEADTIINKEDLDENNTLFLFEKKARIIKEVTVGKVVDLDDYGIKARLEGNNLGYVKGEIGENSTGENITSVQIPSSVYANGNEYPITGLARIGDFLDGTSAEWTNVKSITFIEPSNITTIFSGGLNGLSMDSLTLPSSLTKIEAGGLTGTSNLKTIIFKGHINDHGQMVAPTLENISKLLTNDGASIQVSTDCQIFFEAPRPNTFERTWIENGKIYWDLGNGWEYINNVPNPLSKPE